MTTAGTVDFRLDGRTVVRLVDPSPSDERSVATRLGLRPVALASADTPAVADLTIRYLDDLGLTGRLRSVGRDEGAYTDDVFVIRGRSRPTTVLQLDRIGTDDGEVRMLRGRGAPASLISLVNLALVARGRVALHGSAVVHDGRGIVAVGWSGSGKTEVLLGFMERGALAVGDEWLHADPATGRIAGLPEPVRIEARHLRQLPALTERISRRRRAGMTAGTALASVPGLGGVGRVTGRLGGRTYADVPPARLFGEDRLATSAHVDVVVWLETGVGEGVRAEPVDPASVADRLAFAHVHHRRALLSLYWQARYAFPDRASALLDDIAAVERERIRRCFAGRPAVRVEHPRSADIRAVVDAIEAVIR
jgi:hypothetical protein